MADFNQMGGIPQGYADILKSAQQQLVKMPDGTFQMRPQFGQATNLDEIYGGILPQRSGLASRKVNTVPIDPSTGNPIGMMAPPTASASMAEQRSGIRPAVTQGVQSAGNVQMPPGARPASVERAFAQMGLTPSQSAPIPQSKPTQTVWDPFGTRIANQDQSRLPSSDPRMAFNPDAQNPALAAIDMLTGSGNSAMPRPNPFGYAAPQGGGRMAPRPMPGRPSALSSQQPQGGYTIRKGDTLSSISQRTGIPVQTLAQMNKIKNPDRIFAGQSLNLGMAAPAPSPQAATNQPRKMAQALQAQTPSGGGSKGLSEEGKALRNAFAYAM